MPCLTAIDVLGVQRFVFFSNRLRDVLAGSYLVHWSTSEEGALREVDTAKEILLAGGGNALVETRSRADALQFAARYTRILHDRAPGLRVAVVHKEFESGNLAEALNEIQIELARAKAQPIPSVPLLGLSVTASCRETGLPATGFDRRESTVPLSKLILRRREQENQAKSHWHAYLDCWDDFEFPLDFDDLGRTVADTSFMGVVHIDGNGVGAKIREWHKKLEDAHSPDEVVRQECREWSHAIDQLGREALQAVVQRLCERIKDDEDDTGEKVKKVTGRPARLNFKLKRTRNSNRWFLPLRPILLGGDDLTFVCDGRIALDLAQTALEVFASSNIPHLGNVTACAGVAIVKVHWPFARAYELAAKLCVSAKRMVRAKKQESCALDWHIGTCRPGEAVEELRRRNYQTYGGYKLTCRPYMLDSGKNEEETWKWLSGTLLDDRVTGLRQGAWSRRRNKVKALSGLAREGPDSVSAALEAWRVLDKKLQLPPLIANVGFSAGRTPLIDALELLDLHLVLEGT
ncbi:MAG TPA: hypothetical protein PLP42_01705 [Acidobacteriota bacterium]|nr:hypothetical protein [Acidobacteriota bacterium]